MCEAKITALKTSLLVNEMSALINSHHMTNRDMKTIKINVTRMHVFIIH